MASAGLQSTLNVIQSVKDLDEFRDCMKVQIDECLAKLCLASKEESDVPDKVKEETLEKELEERIAEQKKELIEVKSRLALQQDVLRTFLNSQEAFKAVYSDLFPPDEENPELSEHLRSSIRQKLVEMHEINTKIHEKQLGNDNLRKQMHEMELVEHTAKHRNKESMRLLEYSSEKSRQERLKRKCEEEFSEVLEARKEFENEVRSLRMTKHVFQCLIHGSKIDWYEDKELCDMVIKLGEDEDFDVNVPTDE